MRNAFNIWCFIAIFLIKEDIIVFSSDKIVCTYHIRSFDLICQLAYLKNNTAESVTMDIYVVQNLTNEISSPEFSKYEKGHCYKSDRRDNSCSYNPKEQKFHMVLNYCDSFDHFRVIVVENNKMNSFSIFPCKYVPIIYDVNFVENGTYMGFQWRLRFDNNELPFNDWHRLTYEFFINCHPSDPNHYAKTFQQTYDVIPDRMNEMDVRGNLTPGITYECITNAKYKMMLVCEKKMLCESKWLRETKNIIIRTRNDTPSSGPLFYNGMFQVADGVCYVYFLPVPKEYQNGKIRGYQCIFDDGQIIKTEHFDFKVECSNVRLSGNLSAINYHGIGSVATQVNINQKNFLIKTELELWRTSDRNTFKVRLKLSANMNVTKAFILICKCLRCDSEHPNCISMRTKPYLENQIISVDLNSERASVVVESREQLVLMSDWVKCAYSSTSETMDIKRIMDEIHDLWKTEPSEGNRTFMRVSIPTGLLKCGSQHNHLRPINHIYVKRTCPMKEDFVQPYVRHVGEASINIEIEVFRDCDVLLSVDGQRYVSITTNANEGRFLYLLLILPIFIIIAIIVCSQKRFRLKMRKVHNRCRIWKGKNFGDQFLAQKTTRSMKYTSPSTEEGYEVIEQIESQNYSNTESCMPMYLPQPSEVDHSKSVRNELETNRKDDFSFDKIYTSQNCELKPISEN